MLEEVNRLTRLVDQPLTMSRADARRRFRRSSAKVCGFAQTRRKIFFTLAYIGFQKLLAGPQPKPGEE